MDRRYFLASILALTLPSSARDRSIRHLLKHPLVRSEAGLRLWVELFEDDDPYRRVCVASPTQENPLTGRLVDVIGDHHQAYAIVRDSSESFAGGVCAVFAFPTIDRALDEVPHLLGTA